MSLISNGKKANASIEVIIIVTVLFTFAIATILVFDFFSDITADIIADPDYSSTATAPLEKLESDYPSVFDTAFVIILAAFWIGAIALAFQIDTHPVFFGLSILALIILLSVPPILGNAFEETMEDDSLTGLTDSFPMTYYVMTDRKSVV